MSGALRLGAARLIGEGTVMLTVVATYVPPMENERFERIETVLVHHGVDWGSDVKWSANMDEDDVLDEPTDSEMRITGFGTDRERASRLAVALRGCGMLVSIED